MVEPVYVVQYNTLMYYGSEMVVVIETQHIGVILKLRRGCIPAH